MISQVILNEFRVVGVAFFSGVLITVVYDMLRIFRRVLSHNNFWIGAEDLIFWMWTALWTFSVLYRENDGNLRMYTMFFMAAGMISYHMTISEPLVRILGKIFKKLASILFYPLKLLKFCIIFLGKKLKKHSKGFIMKLSWRKIHGNEDESKKKT